MVMKAGTETFEFEFRGAGKAHYAHNLILTHILEATAERVRPETPPRDRRLNRRSPDLGCDGLAAVAAGQSRL